MIAIIKNKDKTTYCANILAIKPNRVDTQVITFNKDFTHIVKLYMWKPYHQVYMIQEDNLDFSIGKWKGLDWVINDSKLLKKLKKGIVDIKDCPKAKEFAHNVELPEWFEIKSQEDCDNLINISAGFHDGEPIEAKIYENNIELVLDRSFGCKFSLKFMDIVDMDIINRIGLIYDSEMNIQDDNIICWTVTGNQEGWIDGIDWEKHIETDPYIKCKKLLWKLELGDK